MFIFVKYRIDASACAIATYVRFTIAELRLSMSKYQNNTTFTSLSYKIMKLVHVEQTSSDLSHRFLNSND